MSAILRGIRAAIAQGLKDADTPAAGRVWTNRFRAVPQKLLPAVEVLTLREEVEEVVESPREYKRTAELAIDCLVGRLDAPDNDADDRADALAEAIERYAFYDQTFGGVAAGSRLVRVELVPISEGEYAFLVQRLVFQVWYYQPAPEGDLDLLPPLEGAHVDYDLAPPDGALEASDALETVE